MDRQLERCCGLDVHKETIAACVRIGGRTGQATQDVQTFRTTAAELVVLLDWLAAHGVTHVAMESTGVYWKPGVLRTGERLHLPARERHAHHAGPEAEDGRPRLRVDRPNC